MKILATSDFHGHLPNIIGDYDIIIAAGDLCPVTNHSISFQAMWLNTTFKYWTKSLPCKEFVYIAGNHDFVLECFKDLVDFENICDTYLEDTSIKIDGITIYGTPYVPLFGGWAFMEHDEDELWSRFQRIPQDTNILVSHGPPYQILDTVPYNIYGGGEFNENVGSKSLLDHVLKLKDLKLNIFGHIHNAYGKRNLGEVTYANVSYVNEAYTPVNPPMEFIL